MHSLLRQLVGSPIPKRGAAGHTRSSCAQTEAVADDGSPVLPVDVWAYIFVNFFDIRTLFECGLVCEQWYYIIEQAVWKKRALNHPLKQFLNLGTCDILNTNNTAVSWKQRFIYLESLPRKLCTEGDISSHYKDGEQTVVSWSETSRVLTRTNELKPLSTFAEVPYKKLEPKKFSNSRILNKLHSFAQSVTNSPTLRRLSNRPPLPEKTQSCNSEELFYYEATLEEGNVNGIISVGIGICEEGFPVDSFVGWKYDAQGKESIAYHADDGLKRHADDRGKEYGPVWNCGDTVGVGLHFPDKGQDGNVFFTKNGEFLGLAATVSGTKSWFPAIGHTMKFKARVNFGTETFVFNMKNYVANSQHATAPSQ